MMSDDKPKLFFSLMITKYGILYGMINSRFTSKKCDQRWRIVNNSIIHRYGGMISLSQLLIINYLRY